MEAGSRHNAPEFYDNLISSGTKIMAIAIVSCASFYDNLISSGTKIRFRLQVHQGMFYDNLISSGTKMQSRTNTVNVCFTIT